MILEIGRDKPLPIPCRVVSLDIVGASIARPRDFVKQNHIAVRR